MGLAAVATVVVASFQWNAMSGQLKAMKDQLAEMRSGSHDTTKIANATADFAEAMKDQAASTKKLVGATEDSAKSAQSAATATVQGAAAEIKTANAEIASAEAAKKSADTVAASSAPKVIFGGVTMGALDARPDAKGQIEVPLSILFSNVGGSAFHHANGAFVIETDKLPDRPDYSHSIPFGGNELTIRAPGTMSVGPVTVYLSPKDAAAIKANTKPIFIYGHIDYFDNTDTPGRQCFASRISVSNGQFYYYPVGGKAYAC